MTLFYLPTFLNEPLDHELHGRRAASGQSGSVTRVRTCLKSCNIFSGIIVAVGNDPAVCYSMSVEKALQRSVQKMVSRRDPIESAMELAQQPGHFIAWNQESSFVAGLEEVERDVAALTGSDPLRAARLYEAFIAACYFKADEIHSEWEFGRFIAELASGWIRARQASGADRSETARTLLSWIDRDNYGFFNDLGADAAKVLDRTGLAAFEEEVHDRFEKARGNQNDQSGRYSGELWARTLRSIYAQQGSVEKYVAVAERTGLTPGDCAAVARVLESKRKLNDALNWIERGIAMQDIRFIWALEQSIAKQEAVTRVPKAGGSRIGLRALARVSTDAFSPKRVSRFDNSQFSIWSIWVLMVVGMGAGHTGHMGACGCIYD